MSDFPAPRSSFSSWVDGPLWSEAVQKPGTYVRLVLVEAVKHGMPGHIAALLDEMAALLGLYRPLPENQSALLAAPLVQWRSSPDQPTHERVPQVEDLARLQRAQVVFGAGPAGQMVGPAEIAVALGNCHPDFSPPKYMQLYRWAMVHVHASLNRHSPEDAAEDLGWDYTPDSEVTAPGGALHETYQTVARAIRRDAVASIPSEHRPRELVKPIARMLSDANAEVKAIREADGNAEDAEARERLAADFKADYGL